MQQFSADDLIDVLDYPALIEALRKTYRAPFAAPDRTRHQISVPGCDEATLLVMPAWTEGAYLGIKTATIFPSNADRGLPAVRSEYLLMDARDGSLLARMDGDALTVLRTAATSALVADLLAVPEAACMLMVGAGRMGSALIRAHTSIRPFERIYVWNRTRPRAETMARQLRAEGYPVEAVEDLESAARVADLISCATLSRAPLVHGRWVREGAHLDLVGAFTHSMREVDAEAISTAVVFVDTREGAMSEAGDLAFAAKESDWRYEEIAGELRDLAHAGPAAHAASKVRTVFKSVGHAAEDLAAAVLAYERKG